VLAVGVVVVVVVVVVFVVVAQLACPPTCAATAIGPTANSSE